MKLKKKPNNLLNSIIFFLFVFLNINTSIAKKIEHLHVKYKQMDIYIYSNDKKLIMSSKQNNITSEIILEELFTPDTTLLHHPSLIVSCKKCNNFRMSEYILIDSFLIFGIYDWNDHLYIKCTSIKNKIIIPLNNTIILKSLYCYVDSVENKFLSVKQFYNEKNVHDSVIYFNTMSFFGISREGFYIRNFDINSNIIQDANNDVKYFQKKYNYILKNVNKFKSVKN